MKEMLTGVVGFSLVLCVALPVHAYDPDTHRAISTTATNRSNLDAVLKSQYGVENGMASRINGQEIREWIGTGGNREDSPFTRSLNHFHNPLQPWSQAGLTVLGIQLGQSSIYWQQNPAQGFGGAWSWQAARSRFLDFLTKPSKAERDTALADTARAMGQVMHMVQDAAVPAHTRNDPHPPLVGDDDGYEKHIEQLRTEPPLRSQFDSLLAASPLFPASSIFTPTSDPLASVPIARLIDTDRYLRTNPEILTGTSIGVAEYTNGNFFSDDTVFKEFPFPATTSVDLGNQEPEPVAGEPRRYFKKVRDGELIDHLAVPSALYESLPAALRDTKIGLDSKVLDNYAAKLLPRAVGYSAALINYFFRGTLDFEVQDNPTDPAQSKITITNTSLETMIGDFILYADDANGVRTLLATFNLTLASEAQSASQTFLRASNPSEYILVFKGQLGDEKPGSGFIGAVVAKTKKAGEVITTVAGTGARGFSGDGAPATAAQLNVPVDVVIGPDGNLYIADSVNGRIRRVGNDGLIATVAGNGTFVSSGDGGPATAAGLGVVNGIGIGPDGSLYSAARIRIRRVSPGGIITTIAGRDIGGYTFEIPATQADFFNPSDVAAGPDGSIYIADSGDGGVYRVRPDGIIAFFAGNEFVFGIGGFGDGGPATAAGLLLPTSLTLGPDGSVYIVDTGNSRIRRVGPDGIITTVAGSATGGFSGDGGPATMAQLNFPRGVAIGPDGSLYIADSGNNRIRRVRPDGTITTIAGTGIAGFSGDGGPPTTAQLSSPRGVAVGPDGSLYIADSSNHRIRRVGR